MPDSSDSPLASVLGEAEEARAAAIAVATGAAATNVDGLAKKALTLSASGEVWSQAWRQQSDNQSAHNTGSKNAVSSVIARTSGL